MPKNLIKLDREAVENLKAHLAEIANIARELQSQAHYEQVIDLDRLEELDALVDEILPDEETVSDAEDDEDDDD